MPKLKQVSLPERLRASVINVARIHFVFALVLGLQTVIYHAWNLITPGVILGRWIAAVGVGAVAVITWYLARTVKDRGTSLYVLLVFGLVIADIAAVSFNIYTQRGMASRAVALYAVPIIVSAVLLSRAAVFAAAALCAVAYILTAVSYFILNFNEGYKIELYGEVGFYSVMFLLLSGLLLAVIRPKK